MAAKDNNKGLSYYILAPIRFYQRRSRFNKVFILIIITLMVYWRWSAIKNGGLEVDTAVVTRDTLVESISASGEIKAENSANIAFQTAGEVTEVNYKEGDRVEKGDIIAKLDTTNLYNNYLIADAGLRAAQATLNRVYDDVQGHENDESFSQIETRTAAETNKDKAYWAFVSAKKNLEGAYITAPFDGILTQAPTNIVPGAVISLPSGAVFQVVGPETTFFEAQVSEVDIVKLVSGANATIEIDAFPDKVFKGKVTGFNYASTTTSTGGTAYNVRISLPEDENIPFMIGMNGDADIILSEKENLLLAPINSIVEEDDKEYVWLDDNSKASKVEVITGASSINDVEIISGLSEGDTIIIRPPKNIEEGTRVKNQE